MPDTLTAQDLREHLLALVADPGHPEHEEAVRVLLELGFDMGCQHCGVDAGDANPFRPKPKPPVPSA